MNPFQHRDGFIPHPKACVNNYSVKFDRTCSPSDLQNLVCSGDTSKPDLKKTEIVENKHFDNYKFENAGKVIMKNCTFGSRNCVYAVVVNGKYANVKFEKCKFTKGAQISGILCGGVTKKLTFENCEFSNTQFGMKLEDKCKVVVKNCHFHDLSFYGVHVTQGATATIEGCTFERVKNAIILEHGNNTATIKNCKMNEVYETAIATESGSNCLIVQNCLIQKVFDIGILCSDTRYVLAENNTFNGCRTYGIKVEKKTKAFILNNVFKNCEDSMYNAFNEYGRTYFVNNDASSVTNSSGMYIRFNGDGYVYIRNNKLPKHKGPDTSTNHIGLTHSCMPILVDQPNMIASIQDTNIPSQLATCRRYYPENTFRVTKKRNEYCSSPTCSKNRETLKKCAACGIVKYCSRECQLEDWKVHKLICKRIKGKVFPNEKKKE